ncbi:MAG: hypothetical protein HW412_2472, partial [Bacteroidetes bacterium]|nr:hypothetical protein [Bacteroidota bacterium]
MKFFFACSLGLFLSTGEAQNIYLSPASLQFDTLTTNQRDSLSFSIVNHSISPLVVTDINTNRSVFSILDTAFTVQPSDS